MKHSFCNRVAGRLLLAIAAVLILAASATPGQGQSSSRRQASRRARVAEPNATGTGQQEGWAKFEIILKRNIFSRQRAPARRPEAQEQKPATAAPNPESYYLLKGIVQENSEFIAFVEDTQSGAVLRLHQGDRVARGAVKTLTLDSLEYEWEDKTLVIRIGSDLEGGRGAVTVGQLVEWSQTAAPAASSAPGSPPPAPSGAEADILKKLMEQRRQQLGQ